MHKRWTILTGVAVVLAVAGGLVTYLKPGGAGGSVAGSALAAKSPASAVPLEFRPGEVLQPSLARMPQLIEFSGPLVAPNTAIVRAKASGTLLTLGVGEGQRVTAGQPLGRIELAELNNRVNERNANLESARATLAQAERSHASNERLAAQSFISPIALENSRAQLDTARAALSAAQASLDMTRVGLREAVPTAPIAGIVAKRHVLPGEKVAIEQPLVTLVDLAKLELAGTVGTHEVALLSPGMAVQVRVEGMADAVPGRLARIAPAAEAGTRSIGVTIALDNPRETMRAGQYALARVELADPRERLTVPIPAVGNTAGQDHVWLIENGALARRAVTLGRRDDAGGRVEVLTGLTPAAQVLAARFDNLREGTKAGVAADKQTPVASAAASGAALR
jgi:membrane fusion protein, multidrug efflux system